MEKTFMGSSNEWGSLKEIIVGIADNARRPILGLDQLAIEHNNTGDVNDIFIGKIPERIIQEANEDLDELCRVLKDLGVTVHRPDVIDHSQTIKTFNWETDTFYNYCPRDSLLVVDDIIIETPMTMRSRFIETFAYKKILLQAFQKGAKWISAPKPQLLDSVYQNKDAPVSGIYLSEEEPIFDAANILRAGKNIFYLISNTGNRKGAEWLQSILGKKYTVHICENIYSGIHIDSTMAFLRPGLVLLNPERISDDNLPEELKKWDKIWCPNLVNTNKTDLTSLSSVWVGMNLLMVNPNLAIVDKEQTELIKKLEEYNIKVIPLQIRHSQVLGGGFHCVTLDLVRE